MAIIVSQNVDGEIICGCGDTGCCLFPFDYWTDPTPDKYADLPDAVVFNGETLTRNLTPPGFEATFGTIGVGLWINLDYSFNWQFLNGEDTVFRASCLIVMDGLNVVEDQFSNTYIATDDSGIDPPQELTRVSLCRWTGGVISMEYFRDNLIGDFHPTWRLTIAGGPLEKENPQSSPTGQYGSLGFGWVVS